MASRAMGDNYASYRLGKPRHEMQDEIRNGIGIGIFLSLIASVIACIVMNFEGKVVFKQLFNNVSSSKTLFSKEFTVSDEKALYTLNLEAPILRGWAYYDIKIVSKDNKSHFLKLPISLSYYSGYSGGESWSEGKRVDYRYFRLPKGKYKFSMLSEGGKNEMADKGFRSKVYLSLIQAPVSGGYTLRWLILCLLLFGGWIFWAFNVDK